MMESYPSAIPTVVTVERFPPKLLEAHGWTIRYVEGNRIRIRIHDPQFPPGYQTDWLAELFRHEYAHAMNWSQNHDQDHWIWHHDETWGVWYSRLYRAWTGEK